MKQKKQQQQSIGELSGQNSCAGKVEKGQKYYSKELSQNMQTISPKIQKAPQTPSKRKMNTTPKNTVIK